MCKDLYTSELKGNILKVKESMPDRQRSDDRRWEEERRCMKTKETMHK